jgi:2-polyprenyl-3-methyl-5-hydroxy-6-metoxy-1,4-benzoquinol methylase
LIETVTCDLCGSDSTRLLYTQKDYRLRVDDREWNVVQCRNCGLGYLNPRPAAADVDRYYPQSYFSHRRTAEERYLRQARYVPGVGGRLLDIGTARGDFLAVMRKRGWDVTGIEPSESAENPHGLTIHRMRFPEECDLDEQFDVITAWAVFEHLHHPAEAFRACARMLESNGQLIVQVPNLHSIASRWGHQEDVPRHLYFFSESTLRAFGERCGLVLERVVHATDLFGGSGRSILRLALVRALGGSVDDYYELYAAPRRQRFRRWPVLAPALTSVGLVERVVLNNWLVRTLRISGQVVAYFRPAA